MAAPTAKHKIEELRQKRRLHLRQARRADKRRARALAAGKRDKAATAREVARSNRRQAQQALKDIRALRAEYHKHNVLVRLLRSRRKVGGSGGKLTWIDGHQVVSWIAVKYLIPARKAGVPFYVTSGIRTLAAATYLWNNAGRLGLTHYVNVAYPCSSNHCGDTFPKGAVDAWDKDGGSDRLRAYIRAHQVPGYELRAYHDVVGSRDEPHYSHTGH